MKKKTAWPSEYKKTTKKKAVTKEFNSFVTAPKK
jgi:hypothetical protein